jgi:hypothetical protein
MYECETRPPESSAPRRVIPDLKPKYNPEHPKRIRKPAHIPGFQSNSDPSSLMSSNLKNLPLLAPS